MKEETKPCLYQIMGDYFEDYNDEKLEGVGDCSICIRNEDNVFCRMYTPVSIYEFSSEEKKYDLN